MRGPTIKPATGLLTRGAPPAALIDLVLASLPSPNTRRSYAKGIADLYAFAAGRAVTYPLLLEWRSAMAATLTTATVNARITAVRRLVREAYQSRMIGAEEERELLRIDGLPYRGSRIGNWLDKEQTRRILAVPSGKNLRGKRNYCILAVLTGCAIRVSELAALEVETIQMRDGRWVLADLLGKGGRVRSVGVDDWVKRAIDSWTKAAKITEGKLIRQLTLAPEGLSQQGIWDIVHKAAAKIGVPNFGPHDLRRTCARLCREKGGDIEQIQFMLGHASLVTTQRYLGSMQNLKTAVNDNLGVS